MAVQWPLVFFTLLTGLGVGAFSCVAVTEWLGIAQAIRIQGAVTALVAMAMGSGFSFKHWEVYASGHLHDANHIVIDANDTLTLVMDADRQVVAVFGCGGGAELPVLLLALGALAAALVIRRRQNA